VAVAMANYKQAVSIDKIHLLALLIFVAISVFSLRTFFINNEPVAFHDFAPIYRFDQLLRPYDFPWDHKSNLGSPSLLTGNAVYNLPLIGMSMFFGDVAFGGKVLLVLLMGLSGLGFYLAFSYLLKSKTAGFAAGLYMMFNPFTFIRWASGHNTVLLAYMVLSFAVFFFFKVTKESGRLNILVCGLLTALMIYASPQVAYLFILFALLYFVFDLAFSARTGIGKRIMARGAQMGFILVVAVVAAFPFFYQLIMVNLPVYSTRAEEATATFSSTDVIESIIPQAALVAFIISVFFIMWWRSGLTKLYRWWKNNSIEDSSSFLIKVGRQQILFFAVLGLLSVIIILFVIPPFTPVYYWLYDNLPGFGMFREVNKFFLISVLCLAFFVGLIADGLKNYLSRAKSSLLMRKVLPVLLISLIISASSWQFVTGDIGGAVGTAKIPTQYQDFNSWLSSQDGNFRIAFFPPANWATNYSWAPTLFLNPYVALQAKPTVELKIEQDLTQSSNFVRWIYTTLYSNRTSDWGKLLSLLGVKYLIVQLDADMRSDRADLSAFSLANTLASLSSPSDLQLEKNFTSVLIYENPNPIPLIYQSNGLCIVTGDRRTLLSLNTMNFNFTQNPLVFLDDNFGPAASLVGDANYIVFQGDPYWNMLLYFLGVNCVVKPWNFAPLSVNPEDKWVSGDLMWPLFNGDLNVAGDGYIYTEGANTINVPIKVQNAGDYRIVIQVYDGLPDSQGVSFKVDSGPSFIVKPSVSTDGAYKWIDLGILNLNSQSKIQISSLGGPAAISKIAVIPENAVEEVAQNVSKALQTSLAQEVYIFDDRSWKYNDNATIVNPAANDGRLIALSISSAETGFHTFNDGNYTLTLTFQSSSIVSSVKVHFDNSVWNATVGNGLDGFANVAIGPVELGQGYHNITIEAQTGDPRFTLATLTYNMGTDESGYDSSTGLDVPNYIMISGSEYLVNATARYLTFLEAGNTYWRLIGFDGEATHPIAAFNYGSVFPIENSGQYTLRYLGLGYVEVSSLVALVLLAIIMLALKFMPFRRFTLGDSTIAA
jgi:hypothetical protein